jgi:HK97 family phage portal protein
MFNFLKGEVKQVETKTIPEGGGGRASQRVSFVDFLNSSKDWDLSFRMQIDYYQQCAPFADAVDTISQAYAQIQPMVIDTVTDKFVDHPVLDLLAKPNSTQSKTDFFEYMCMLYLVTGNPFLQSLGNVQREPLSIDCFSPTMTELVANNMGLIGIINVMSEFINDTYTEKQVNGRTRFYSGDDRELWPIQRLNPKRHSSELYGCPKIKSLFYDIEQLILAGRHNTSLLKRGARPGGSITTRNDEAMTDEQFERLQDQLQAYYTGPDAAGRPIILENGEYKENIVNNRDMDYKTMKQDAKEAIYTRMDIPLPTVSTGTMTHSNFESGQVALYDAAVLPVTDKLYEHMTLALIPRYTGKWGDAKRYQLAYDTSKITAMQLKRTESILNKAKVRAHTINELRAEFGDGPTEGGDVLANPPGVEGKPAILDTNKKAMYKALQSATTSTGEKRFTQEQIDRLTKDAY